MEVTSSMPNLIDAMKLVVLSFVTEEQDNGSCYLLGMDRVTGEHK